MFWEVFGSFLKLLLFAFSVCRTVSVQPPLRAEEQLLLPREARLDGAGRARVWVSATMSPGISVSYLGSCSWDVLRDQSLYPVSAPSLSAQKPVQRTLSTLGGPPAPGPAPLFGPLHVTASEGTHCFVRWHPTDTWGLLGCAYPARAGRLHVCFSSEHEDVTLSTCMIL